MTKDDASDEIVADVGDEVDSETELSDQLKAIEGEIIDVVGKVKGERILRLVSQKVIEHRGPLPHPSTLQAYKDIDARIVDEVLEGARANRDHRIAMDKKLVNSARYSVTLSFVMMLAAFGLAWLFVAHDQAVIGALFGAAGVGQVAVAMIKGGGDHTGRANDDSKSDDPAPEETPPAE